MNSTPIDRYQSYREIAQEHGLDAVALVPGSNFRRLYGHDFHQNERPLLVMIPPQGVPAAIVPALESGSFDLLDFEGEIFKWRDEDGYADAFKKMSDHLSAKRIGVEGQGMRVFIHHALKTAYPEAEILDHEKSLSGVRVVKTQDEIADMKQAIIISESALEETLNDVRIGVTEKAIESVLMQNLLKFGAEEFAFSPIVAAGDNSARPHASAREDYKLKQGDALLLDFGARYNGLCADITRTFFISDASEEQADVYDTVLQANLAGHAATTAGVTAHDVDDAVISYLENSPYAARIRTKTGHGVGRDIHEDPYIMRGNSMELQSGMVFTIEPGLYDDGNFGVRIEDDVVVTENGLDCLTSFNKELTII